MQLPTQAKQSSTTTDVQTNAMKSTWRWLVPVFVVALIASTLSVAAFVPQLVSAQTLTVQEATPGGIAGADVVLWLRSDTGTGATANGDSISTWQDQSGLGNDAVADAVGNEPTFSTDRSVNFNPTIEFATPDTGATDDTKDYLNVPTIDDVRGAYWLAANDDFGQSAKHFLYSSDGNNLNQFHGGVDGAVNSSSVPGEWRVNGTAGSFNTAWTGGADLFSVETTAVEIVENVGGHQTVDPSRSFDGAVGEVVLTTNPLSDDDRRQLESYLALKYGITLDIALASYTNSAGAPVFADATHWNDVAGIATDSASGLDQRVSTSGNDDAVVTIATTSDFTSSNLDAGRTSLADGAYAVWGNDDGAATFSATGAPADHEILDRTWTIIETGTVGAVQIQVDVDDADFDLGEFTGDLHLVAGSDLSAATPIAMTDAGNGLWTVANDFADGDLFSFVFTDVPAFAAPDLQAGDDTGVSTTDDLTSKPDALFNVECPTNGHTINLYSDNPAPGTLVGVHACTGPGQAVTAGNGSVAAGFENGLTEGVHNLTYTITPNGGAEGPESLSLEVTVDLTGPAAPSTPADLQPGSDTGTSDTDDLTSEAQPSFDVECSAAGQLVWLYSDQYTSPVGSLGSGSETASVPNPTTLTISTTFTAPYSGQYVFVRRAGSFTRTDGGTGNANGSLAIGTSAGAQDVYFDNATAARLSRFGPLELETTVTLTGGVEYFVHAWSGGASILHDPSYEFLPVNVFTDRAAIGFHTCDGAGTETVTADLLDLDEGVHNISYTVEDEAGNQSAASPSLELTIAPDPTAPDAPAQAPDLQAGSDNGAADNDNVTSTLTHTFDVRCTEQGSTITLLSDSPTANTTVATHECLLPEASELTESTNAALVASSPAGTGDDVEITLAPGEVRRRTFHSPITVNGSFVTVNHWPYREELPNNYADFTDVIETTHTAIEDPPGLVPDQRYGTEWTFVLEPGVYSFGAGGADDGYSLAFSPTGNQMDLSLIHI